MFSPLPSAYLLSVALPLFLLVLVLFNSSSPRPSFLLLHAPLRQIARHDNQRIFAVFLGTMARRESQVEREFLDTALAGLGLGNFASLPVVLWQRTRVWRVLHVHVGKINRPKCTPPSVRQAPMKVEQRERNLRKIKIHLRRLILKEIIDVLVKSFLIP